MEEATVFLKIFGGLVTGGIAAVIGLFLITSAPSLDASAERAGHTIFLCCVAIVFALLSAFKKRLLTAMILAGYAAVSTLILIPAIVG